MTNNDLVYTTYINTTPEKVWTAITNPEFTHQYWGEKVNVSDWQTGSAWQHEDRADGNAVRITGKVLEASPPHRLVLSWASPSSEADISTVTFDIRAVQGMVRLDVTHSGLQLGSGMLNGVSRGWPLVLSSMKSFLETGNPIDIMAVLNDKCPSKEAA